MKDLMKLQIVFLMMLFLSFQSCDGPDLAGMQDEAYNYQDSVTGLVPGMQTVQARLERDFNTEKVTLKLIIGSPAYYDASPDQKQEAAIRAGQIAVRMFGKNVDKGALIITKDLRNHPKDPEDGRMADMKIDSLKRTAAGN